MSVLEDGRKIISLWGSEPLRFPATEGREITLEMPNTFQMDPSYLDHALMALAKFSRTFNGIGSTEVSEKKLTMQKDGDLLVRQVENNFRIGTQFFYQHLMFGTFHKQDRAQAILHQAPGIFNAGITDPRQDPLRKWETPYGHTSQMEILAEMSRFCEAFAHLLHVPGTDPKIVAASIEYILNGKIHPYSDGCGRISRGLSTAYLALHEIYRPVFNNREEYITAFEGSMEQWCDYFCSSIPASPQ